MTKKTLRLKNRMEAYMRQEVCRILQLAKMTSLGFIPKDLYAQQTQQSDAIKAMNSTHPPVRRWTGFCLQLYLASSQEGQLKVMKPKKILYPDTSKYPQWLQRWEVLFFISIYILVLPHNMELIAECKNRGNSNTI